MRLVGKPGSQLDLATCATDLDGIVYCSEDTISMSRIAGTSRFKDVSKQMLSISADIDGDGDLDEIPLFSDLLQDYYWNVDTQGRLHAQVRFCPL